METGVTKELIDDLKEMLIKNEGMELKIYRCGSQKLTIGAGRNIDPDGGIGLSESEITFLLMNDIQRCRDELEAEYEWFDGLNEARKDVLINMVFNLGATRFRDFQRAIKAISEGKWQTAHDEMLDSRWADQVGDRAKELAEQMRSGQHLT